MLDWPIQENYVITQGFGENPGAYQYICTPDGSHNGLDLAVPIGTPVFAAMDGVVKEAGADKTGYGLHVKLLHPGGGGSIYAHLSKVVVSVGQPVCVGQLIGLSGNSGNSTGPHLHFEYRTNLASCKTAADPLPLLKIHTTLPTPAPSQSTVSTETVQKVVFSPGEEIAVGEDELNARQGPGTNHVRLGRLMPGAPAKVIEQRGDWVKAQVVVWLHRDYLIKSASHE